jgi:uncharacterized protein (TIGR04141 family)
MTTKAKQTPVQSVRIYLLKESVTNYEDALREGVDVIPHALEPDLRLSGIAYVRRASAREPRWVKFLQSGLAKRLPRIQSTAHAAVVFLQIDGRIVALVFGMGRYLLKDTCYEADFGIIAALNSVDPNGLRSADTFQFEAVALHKKTQTSRSTSLAEFEIDTSREQFRSLTGKAGHTLNAARVTGSEGAFGANVRVTFRDLVDVCRKVVKASRAPNYKTAFPRFDNLRRVADSQKLQDLNAQLVAKLITGATTGIHLSPPELVDYEDFEGFSFTPRGTIHEDLLIEDYLRSLKDKNTLSLQMIKNNRVFLRKETIDEPLTRWSLFKCLICEIPDGHDIFLLMNGEWYKIARTFVRQVSDAVACIPEVDVGLPPLGECKTETEYLKSISSSGTGLIVLDQQRAYCEDALTYIEVCDVLTATSDLVHIKRAKGGSSVLSHLFNQGRNAALALLRDQGYRDEARALLAPYGQQAVERLPKATPVAGSLRVVFGIIGRGRKDIARSLPFFSQLCLKDVKQALAERSIEVGICGIAE